MTPKEKAKKLFTKFSANTVHYDETKQCALIVVDEMFKYAGFIWGGRDTETGLSARDQYRKYWQEVKQEIEKL